jgi:hypothetical protein
MPKDQHPSRQPLNKRHGTRSGAIKSSDPPLHTKRGATLDAGYQHRVPVPSLGHQLGTLATDLYGLGRHPWLFVAIVLSYFILSVIWLIEKMSAFNMVSALVSLFVLIYAIAHNLLELVDCLGTIFRQLGWAFSILGRRFRRMAKRMRETFGRAQRV